MDDLNIPDVEEGDGDLGDDEGASAVDARVADVVAVDEDALALGRKNMGGGLVVGTKGASGNELDEENLSAEENSRG